MTFQVWVKDNKGNPIEGVYVQANDLMNGQTFSRTTDGRGYADVAMLGTCAVNDHVTMLVFDPKNRYQGADQGDALVITDHDQLLDYALLPFNKASVLPAPPTRDRICGINTHLAGLTYNTTQYGPIPAWFYAILNPTDQAIARAAHKAVGDDHIPVGISEAYIEPGTLWPYELQLGYDFAYDLDKYRAVITPLICDGLLVDLPLAGDGMSVNSNPQPGQYNDPQGNTYGWQWLMANFPRIVAALKGDGTPAKPDLTPYIIFRPGWDDVFYGWGVEGEVPDQQPDRVREFGELFRSLLPLGHLAIEHTPGNIPCGEGGGDFAPGGLMRNYDTIMSEFNTVHENSFWQVVGRMVHPYNRPADQTAGDDNPPFYLAPGNERGPYFYVAFEPTKGGVYEWCRGRCTVADVEAVRAYSRATGCAFTG